MRLRKLRKIDAMACIKGYYANRLNNNNIIVVVTIAVMVEMRDDPFETMQDASKANKWIVSKFGCAENKKVRKQTCYKLIYVA